MDYEKAYKAVLKTATQWIKDGCTDKEKICLECVIPELRESEDERIRKWMVDYFGSIKETVWIHRDITCEQILAYLEKQGPAWSEDDERILKGIIGKIDHDQTYGVSKDEMLSFLNRIRPGREPMNGIHWKRIKAGERLPCYAYVWGIAFSKDYECFQGRLIPNVPGVELGCDTWYLPVKDIRNLPREGHIDYKSDES